MLKTTKAFADKCDSMRPDEAVSPMSFVLRINGMREVGEGMFEVSGIKPRNIDWDTVKAGFGGLSDEAVDRLASVLWRQDMIELLLDRVQP